MMEYDTNAAAQYLNCTADYVRRIALSRRLIGTRRGRGWLFTQDALDDYLASRAHLPYVEDDCPRPAELMPDDAAYNYNSCVHLAQMVMLAAVEDIKAGYPEAVAWLDSPDFDWWCDVVGLHPQRIRNELKQVASTGWRFTSDDKLDHVIDLHDIGHSWREAIRRVYGHYHNSIEHLVYKRRRELNLV